TTTSFNAVVAQARSVNPSIKIFICTGGAPGSDVNLSTRLAYIGNNAGICNKFCNNILAFIKANNLDGWDLDWEFPTTAGAKTAHQNLLAKMRFKVDSMNVADGKSYEISIAIGGGNTDALTPGSPGRCWANAHTDYINGVTALGYVDYVNIMTYDGNIGSAPCSFSSHQHFNLMTKAISDWNTRWGLSKSKMMMGVGFYDNGGASVFNGLGNVATNYNANPWGNGGGDGCNNLKAKISYINTNCMPGIFIWELSMDNLCTGGPTTCYSLLECMYTNRGTSACGPAPVVLTDFSAGLTGNHQALVKWSTVSETNHDYYMLQSSADAQNFTDVVRIQSKGSQTQGASYSFTDSPGSGTTYYRLAIVSLSGELEYSKIIALNQTLDFAAYPNPFNHTINMTFNHAAGSEAIKLKVFNAQGIEVLNRDVTSAESSITTGETWPNGIYMIHLSAPGGVRFYKVEKQ
ncbi:MAG: glycosyl hydrolase family 18 protein, partial [Cytophagaceae bacterium]